MNTPEPMTLERTTHTANQTANEAKELYKITTQIKKKQEKHSQVLREIQALQHDQGRDIRMIERRQEVLRADVKVIKAVLADHGNRLDSHDKKLDEHGRKLEEHGRKLDEHGRKLDEHGKILDRHTGMLTEILEILRSGQQSAN